MRAGERVRRGNRHGTTCTDEFVTSDDRARIRVAWDDNPGYVQHIDVDELTLDAQETLL